MQSWSAYVSFLFLCFGNPCIQAQDSYFGSEALDFFFLWDPLVGAYCFYKTDLSYFTQRAFIERNMQLLTMKILVEKSLLTVTVRLGTKLLEFFLFSSAVIKKLPWFPKSFCLALYFPASLNRGRESRRWLKTTPCYKCHLPCISDEENTSGTWIGNSAFTQKS